MIVSRERSTLRQQLKGKSANLLMTELRDLEHMRTLFESIISRLCNTSPLSELVRLAKCVEGVEEDNGLASALLGVTLNAP